MNGIRGVISVHNGRVVGGVAWHYFQGRANHPRGEESRAWATVSGPTKSANYAGQGGGACREKWAPKLLGFGALSLFKLSTAHDRLHERKELIQRTSGATQG